ncbi:MAG: hypothetical protein ACTSQ8_08120 [Candidatus Helarchaeota archaeon]
MATEKQTNIMLTSVAFSNEMIGDVKKIIRENGLSFSFSEYVRHAITEYLKHILKITDVPEEDEEKDE